MRRISAAMAALVLLTGCLSFPALAYGAPVYSADAVVQYCGEWNEFYQEYDPLLHGRYTMADDHISVKEAAILYNQDHREVNYGPEILPPAACLVFQYSFTDDEYVFSVCSDEIQSGLEEAVFRTDEGVVSGAGAWTGRRAEKAWSIGMATEQLLELLSVDHFTMEWTMDGKSETIDISKENNDRLYEMLHWLIGIRLYSDTTYENYLDSVYLPGPEDRLGRTPVPTATPEPVCAESLPVGTEILRDGAVNHYVNFRSGPSVDSPKAGDPLQAGTPVFLIANERNSLGEIWTRVRVDGREGYVKSEYIDVDP